MATLTVGKPGTGEVFDFTTISAAVTAAHNGDVINVSGGPDHIYINDFPIIKKSLTLQAVGGEVQMVATVSPGNGKAMIVAGNPGWPSASSASTSRAFRCPTAMARQSATRAAACC